MENKRDFAIVKYYTEYRFTDLGKINYHFNARKKETSVNLIICADTETSKQNNESDPMPNYIVAWSICVFNYMDDRQCVYYGHKPNSIIEFMNRLKKDIDANITIYFHNLNYDYTFLRQFAFSAWGLPQTQLAVKPHKPLVIRWTNAGITWKDSLILSQRSLERWANDLNAAHKKAVGSWDYLKIRSQKEQFSDDELLYISNDVLAQSECINIMRLNLGITAVDDMPLTSTSIIRNEARNRSRGNVRNGRLKWHSKYINIVPGLEVYNMLERAYHGGFTHANRFCIGDIYNDVTGYDFASSYPFTMLSEKFPMDKFERFEEATPERILKLKNDFAFVFELLIYDFELKEGLEMPYLQRSKITKWSDDFILDNGRVISGSLAQITYTEIDLELFVKTYDFKMIAVKNCFMSAKAYLPVWLRSYIYELFKEKTLLKNSDPVLYGLAKARLNGVYGMCVEKNIRLEFIENYETGEYTAQFPEDREKALMKRYNSRNSFLPYQWGVWVCAYAARNLFELGQCCGLWLYSDTDSVKGLEWNNEKVETYNNRCKEKLLSAGIFEPVLNGREYWLGIAEFDGSYSEFVTLGSKRYCVRENGKLKITVAGVPKKGAECLHDDITNFKEGLIFDGKTSGKKQLTYFLGEEIREDNGIVFGDSIDLSECDYLLSATEKFNGFWEVWEDELPLDFQ